MAFSATDVVAARPVVLALHDPRATDPARAGAKASALARALQAGLPVVPGAVLTTAAAAVPAAEAAGALWAAVAPPPGRSLVVRSSSTGEDGKRRSMAGLFRSVNGVTSLDELVAAVEAVRESARVVPLAVERAEMAVLVQRELGGGPGGVLFGVDPVSGRTDRLMVVAHEAGPVGVVAGATGSRPWLLSVRGRVLERPEGSAAALPPAVRRTLARMANRTADLFGGPQDVEWAADSSGTVWLLQSRPVTATGAGVPRRGAPVMGTGPVAETFPDRLSPLEADLWVAPLAAGVRAALAIAGTASPRRLRRSPVVTTVGGWAAVDLELMGAPPGRRHHHRMAGMANPARAGRRLRAAWRVGRLRSALPSLAADLLGRADADLVAVDPLAELPDHALLSLIDGCAARLTALHGHEVLMGWLLAPGARGDTAAAVALDLLAADRAAGLDDAAIVALHPTVLALVPPTIGKPVVLPAVTAPIPRPPAGGHGGPAELREALRLRTRWYQELSARAAAELGSRLHGRNGLDEAGGVRWLSLPELRTALATDPSATRRRAAEAAEAYRSPGDQLPDRFRLAADGTAVAVAAGATGPRDGDGRAAVGVGASAGRASGRVHQPEGDDDSASAPPDGAILVVHALEPRLAAWLPRLGGLVAETGSPLSHLAILAREYRVPAVVAVADARRRFPPGSRVTIDGTQGRVVTDAAIPDGDTSALPARARRVNRARGAA